MMRLSLTVIAGVLLASVASPMLAASPYNQGGCSANVPEHCLRIDHAGGKITQNRAIDSMEMVRLDSKDPDAHRSRGTKEQAKSDLNQTIAYYNAAIRLDPKDDDAYFHRALANFYTGALPKALADLGQANKLDPEYAYYSLWLEIVGKRGNLPSQFSQAIAQVNMTKWPAPVIRLFLGQTTPAAVLAAANDPDPKTKRGQVCEANFYVGEMALQQGSTEEAARLFRLAAADCPREFVEGHSASAELEALGGTQ
jgi:lipoprotein NlpI